MRRVIAAAGAVLGLVLVLVGAPWALAAWGKVGQLAEIDWARAFVVRDDGRLLLGVLSLVGWLAWLVLFVSIVVETVEVVDRLRAERAHRPHRPVAMPGLDLPRLLVRGLVVSVVTAAFGLALPRVHAPAATQTVGVSAPVEQFAPQSFGDSLRSAPWVGTDFAPATRPAAVPSKTAQKPLPTSALHVVQPYDDLRTLAARYYGDAAQWQRIADANGDLLKGQAVVRTGWRLVIPGVAASDGTCVVIVARGDSLSRLAARYLGDGDRWPEIYALNRDVVDNPDEIDIGWRLKLPSGVVLASGAPVAASVSTGTGPASSSTAAASTVSAPTAPQTATPSTPPATPVDEPSGLEVYEHGEVPVAPVQPAAEPSAPTAATQEIDSVEDHLSVSQALAMGVVGTVGAGMASAVVRTVHRRRDVQLALRPVGRRIPYPSSDTMHVESALAVVGLTPPPVPPVVAGPPEDDEPTIVGPRRALPDPTYPALALVAVGFGQDGPMTLDLEEHRLTSIDLGDPQATWGTACAWALELACAQSPDDEAGPADGATVVAVGPLGEALAAAALDSIKRVPSVDAALTELAAVVQQQQHELAARAWTLGQARADIDARDAWWPRVYVFPTLDELQTRRLGQALAIGDATAVSAIVVRSDEREPMRAGLGARLTGTADLATLEPGGVTVRPVSLSSQGRSAVVELLRTSGIEDTWPAPWFAPDDVADNVLPLHPRLAGSTKEVVDVGDDTPGVTDFSHPTLMLLGPIQLLGAAGPPPTRSERSCIEYCAWMVEHPGATASQMAAALMVAETTRRSNVSRLRGWLGTMEDDNSYLPEAYTGRLYLDATVSSDWQRLTTLVSPGINRVPMSTLVSALRLVRGAPLADAAPGQWHWAEELRTDMASLIRDIGARVGEAALADGDLDLARWAASRALTASPGDETLVRLRLRTEHRAGNRPEVERIVLQLTRHARVLGIDLDDETVRAIQEAIEGQPRARA